jgi:hypothetical protein
MLKKRDDDHDEVDDEVRTSASQSCATAHCILRNSSSGLSIYSSLLLSTERSGGGGRQEIDSQYGAYRRSQQGSQLLDRPYKPGDKKHEPSKWNYYTFGGELTPLGINSLSLA